MRREKREGWKGGRGRGKHDCSILDAYFSVASLPSSPTSSNHNPSSPSLLLHLPPSLPPDLRLRPDGHRQWGDGPDSARRRRIRRSQQVPRPVPAHVPGGGHGCQTVRTWTYPCLVRRPGGPRDEPQPHAAIDSAGARPSFLPLLPLVPLCNLALSLTQPGLGVFLVLFHQGASRPTTTPHKFLPPSLPLSRALLFLPQHQEAKKEQEELATIKQVRRQVQAKFPGTKLPEIPSEMAKEKVREGGRCRPSMHLRREAAFGQGVEKDALKHVTFTLILTYTTTTTT